MRIAKQQKFTWAILDNIYKLKYNDHWNNMINGYLFLY